MAARDRAAPRAGDDGASPCGPVLVTGAAGFLGSELVRQSIAAGHDVCAAVRPGGSADRLAGLECAVHPVDLADLQQVADLVATLQPSLVVHAAASNGHAHTAEERAAAWRDSTLTTVHLLEALAGAPDAVLVHVGSGTEYGPSDAPMCEDRDGAPTTVRGVTKRAATLAVRQWARAEQRPAVVVRPFSIYGPREQPTKLVPTLLRCAVTGEPFPAVDTVSRRDLVHVADVAEGCRRAAAVASPKAPVVNLGTGVEHSVDEVRRIVEDVTGRTVRVQPAGRARQAHDVEHWLADTTRCRELLGWVPGIALRDGIAALVPA